MLDAYRRFRIDQIHRAQKRWREPITTWPRRVGAWISLIFADHGFVRPVYWNSHEIRPGVWRGPQPSPVHIGRMARKGIRTLVNLRGATQFGSYALEHDAAKRHGMVVEDFIMQSRGAPRRDQIHGFDDLIRRIEYPAVFHCKSGADRSGLASALYLILMEGMPVEEAWQGQLSFRFGHIKASKAGLIDAFFARYVEDTRETPMDFLTWVDTVYDKDQVERDFHASFWGNVLQERILGRE